MIWPRASVSTPWIRFRVVCGLSDMMAILWPMAMFKRVDFPTLGRPMMATNPDLCPLFASMEIPPSKGAGQQLGHRLDLRVPF